MNLREVVASYVGKWRQKDVAVEGKLEKTKSGMEGFPHCALFLSPFLSTMHNAFTIISLRLPVVYGSFLFRIWYTSLNLVLHYYIVYKSFVFRIYGIQFFMYRQQQNKWYPNKCLLAYFEATFYFSHSEFTKIECSLEMGK